MFLYAADLLDEGQQLEIRAHVAGGCPRCVGALAEAEAELTRIPASAPPVAPPPRVLNRLIRRVTSDRARGTRSPNAWGLAMVAACIGLVVGGVALHFYARQRHQRATEQLVTALADRQQQLDDLRGMITSEKLRLVAFSAAQATSSASGRILWDQDHDRWHVQVFDLKPPQSGRTYELWFISPQEKKIPAGTFDTDASGRGSILVEVPKDLGPIALAAITDEPAGGSLQPTGSIHLVGKIE
jgi:anti-sigma-K factor RskA